VVHRFFVPADSFQGEQVLLPDPAAHQVRNVLRLQPGDTVAVFDGGGWEWEIRLIEVSRAGVSGQALGKRPNRAEPRLALTLYQCLLKKDNFEWVLQKGTELGVSRFVPAISRRTVKRGSDRGTAQGTRWQRIVTEAAEQSGRGIVPAIDAPLDFAQAVVESARADLALIAWEQEHSTNLRAVLAGQHPLSVALMVGPEGGFAPEEVALAAGYGVQPVTLGPRLLRAETAAVALAALILFASGEMG
jgi:16S rRNA (uracil1498-N3)-methyltransferase